MMATYWTKMEDEAIRKYEAEINDPSDPNNAELTDINVETVNSIMNFLEDLDWLENLEMEHGIGEISV